MASSGTCRAENQPATAAAPISSSTRKRFLTEKSMTRSIMARRVTGPVWRGYFFRYLAGSASKRFLQSSAQK